MSRAGAAREALDRTGAELTWDMIEIALSAADAVMFSDEAVETLERVLIMHAVITDGLEEGSGWCSQCGNVDDDNEAHLASAVIAALKGADA